MDKLLFVFSFLLVVFGISCSPESDTKSTNEDSLDGEYVYKLGKSFNKTILLLLGKVFMNAENTQLSLKDETMQIRDYICRKHRCSEWSIWGACSVKKLFGISERNRTCGLPSTLCPTPQSTTVVTPSVEKETQLCKGSYEHETKLCPDNYTLTDNGFCLQYYATSINYTDATSHCQKDGGHVVNINSQNKADDTHAVIGSKTIYWINGKRADTNSPWEVTYETENGGFSNWYSSEPESFDMCRVESGESGWLWFGEPCTNYRIIHVVCEVILDV